MLPRAVSYPYTRSLYRLGEETVKGIDLVISQTIGIYSLPHSQYGCLMMMMMLMMLADQEGKEILLLCMFLIPPHPSFLKRIHIISQGQIKLFFMQSCTESKNGNLISKNNLMQIPGYHVPHILLECQIAS